MGGATFDDEYDVGIEENYNARNVILVGKVGNGKSATGNSILGNRSFLSKPSSVGVTSTSQLQTTVLQDGQVLNIIDTPGLLDFSRETQQIRDEIMKCFKMVKDGIHAVLVVLSIRSRCSLDEKFAFEYLLEFFGGNISDYMIVIFTGGDELEEIDETLDDYLGGGDCPGPFKEILEKCGNRRVLFDNKTKDDGKRCEQVNQLFKLVNEVVDRNGGKPFTDELFIKMQKCAHKLHEQVAKVNSMDGFSEIQISEFKEQFDVSYEARLKRLANMMEMKLKEATQEIEKKLEDEKAARILAEKIVLEQKAARLEEENVVLVEARKVAKQELEKKNENERQLREELDRAQREAAELRDKAAQAGGCNIL